MDWNNDGKEDWQDAVIYHDIIEPMAEEEHKEEYPIGSKKNDSKKQTPPWVIVALILMCVIYFICLLAND